MEVTQGDSKNRTDNEPPAAQAGTRPETDWGTTQPSLRRGMNQTRTKAREPAAEAPASRAVSQGNTTPTPSRGSLGRKRLAPSRGRHPRLLTVD